MRRVCAGAIVDMSTHSVPSAAAGRDAVVAEQDRLDLGAVDDHRDDDVARRRRPSAGVSATVAPCSAANASARSRVRLKTVSS